MLADCPDVWIQRYLFLYSSPKERHKSSPVRSRKEWFLLAEVRTGIQQQADLLHLLQLRMTEIAMTAQLATFEDSTLIKLALAGQVECFSILMDRHSAVVRRRIGSMV